MKLINLDISWFRRFDHFRLNNLGRVNLLVGTNNCGKTTILEAVSILLANGNFSPIWSALVRRGEEIIDGEGPATAEKPQILNIRRLFHRHEIEVGKEFLLSAGADDGKVSMTAKIGPHRPDLEQFFAVDPRFVDLSEEFFLPLSLSLYWKSPGSEIELTVPMSKRGGLTLRAIERYSSRLSAADGFPKRFITGASLSAEVVSSMFEEIVLTPEENLVTDAMRIIEPKIERITSSGTEGVRSNIRYSPRGGILVRLEGVSDRIPIGSMGDGIWRILGLALSVVGSAGGILLVDEIDTGLHHTVMEQMWRFLYKAAKQYNVQVIATTHSWDCYHSLAVICRDEVSEGSEVTINRIESGREEAVSYTEQEIKAAAELDIEVR